jgi:hypothetical protein
MTTHLFYHQETVEEVCALNSWRSIRDNFAADDEVIVLDLGNTLRNKLPLTRHPKFFRTETIRTDTPEERSYTFGLNTIMPLARADWICLWRSDYIYHQRYFPALKKQMPRHNVIVPYEAFVGTQYANGQWCAENFTELTTGSEDYLIEHSTVCPVYEVMDCPHFAIKKDLWQNVGGMDQRLWGYGWQFPELFHRVTALPDCRLAADFDLLAFHQNHAGSFGLGQYTEEKKRELIQSEYKLREVFGSKDAAEQFKKRRQPPLRPRRDPECYKLKVHAVPLQTEAR